MGYIFFVSEVGGGWGQVREILTDTQIYTYELSKYRVHNLLPLLDRWFWLCLQLASVCLLHWTHAFHYTFAILNHSFKPRSLRIRTMFFLLIILEELFKLKLYFVYFYFSLNYDLYVYVPFFILLIILGELFELKLYFLHYFKPWSLRMVPYFLLIILGELFKLQVFFFERLVSECLECD